MKTSPPTRPTPFSNFSDRLDISSPALAESLKYQLLDRSLSSIRVFSFTLIFGLSTSSKLIEGTSASLISISSLGALR